MTRETGLASEQSDRSGYKADTATLPVSAAVNRCATQRQSHTGRRPAIQKPRKSQARRNRGIPP